MRAPVTLFHGSPHDIKEKIVPSQPRGRDAFQTQKAVFMTDIEKSAQIYAITRDKQRKRKGWFVYQDQLHILKPYTLNKRGYVYVTTTRNYMDDPVHNPNQYAIKKAFAPNYRYIVNISDIIDNIVEYDTKEAWIACADELLG